VETLQVFNNKRRNMSFTCSRHSRAKQNVSFVVQPDTKHVGVKEPPSCTFLYVTLQCVLSARVVVRGYPIKYLFPLLAFLSVLLMRSEIFDTFFDVYKNLIRSMDHRQLYQDYH
jgi:hypothetical protein